MSLFRGIKYFLLAEKSKKNTLKEILGFKPKNLALYEQAFVHKSILNESDQGIERESNERLEFLGDAILGAVVAQYLFLKYPKCNEGELTKFRSKIVNRRFLNSISLSATHLNINFGVEDEFESKYQIESIRTQVIGRVNHNIFKGLKHSLGVRYIDRYHFSESYLLIDTRLILHTERYGLFAEATNLLNRKYNESNLAQMPGRWVRFGANVKIGY